MGLAFPLKERIPKHETPYKFLPVNIDGGATTLNLNVSFQGYTLQAFNGEWYITQRF